MAATDLEEGSCPLCGDRGWVIASDGGAGTAHPCSCRQETVVPRLLEAAAIPPRYRHCTLTSFKVTTGSGTDPRLLEAQVLCRRYIDCFVGEDGRMRESGLLFIGPPGVGKTHLAVAILGELIQRYRARGRFVDFNALIHQIQSTFDPGSPESKHDVLDPVIEAEVLVLDELGAQKPTPWVNDVLYLIMNSRYTGRRPTLFTTNYRLDPAPTAAASEERSAAAIFGLLASRIPPMLLSRLYEMARPVLLDCGDFRREVSMQRLLR